MNNNDDIRTLFLTCYLTHAVNGTVGPPLLSSFFFFFGFFLVFFWCQLVLTAAALGATSQLRHCHEADNFRQRADVEDGGDPEA